MSAAGHDHGGHDHAGHDHHDHHDLRYFPPDAQPEVFAAEAEARFAQTVGQARVEEVVNAFLRRLSDGLGAAGCVLVGHIKGVVAAEAGDELAFSLTSLHGVPQFSGGLQDGSAHFHLTLNVIVFGVDPDALPVIVTEAWPDDGTTSWRPQ
jgi:hypothetical protein